MEEDWTAAADIDGEGRNVVALRLTDGAVVYLDPMLASRFAEQIRAAVTLALFRDETNETG